MKKIHQNIFVFLLLTIFFILSISNIIDHSYMVHESFYLFSGYTYLKEGNSFNINSPLLFGIVGAIPLLFMDIDYPPIEEIDHPWDFGRNEWLFYGNNDPDQILFWARLPFIFLGILFGIYVFKWAKELYGFKRGLFSLFLYIFFPFILAFTSFVITDLLVSGFMFISLYYFWKLIKTNKQKNLIFSGIFYGLAISSKVTATILLPFLLIYLLLYQKSWKKSISNFVLFCLIAIAIFSFIHINEIHPVYTYDDPFYSSSKEFRSPEKLENLINSKTQNTFLSGIIKFALTKIPVPGPHSIQAYLAWTVQKGHQPRFLMGSYNDTILLYFAIFLFNLPIAFIIFLIWAIIQFFKNRKKQEYFLILSAGYFLFIIFFILTFSRVLRYILLPLLLSFVFVGRIYKKKFIIFVLLAWYIISTLFIAPYYISYFNEFVGPENGYKYLGDQDQGQDLKRLSIYLKENNITNVKLDYVGFTTIGYWEEKYGINYEILNCTKSSGSLISPGYTALSVKAIQGSFWTKKPWAYRNLNCYKWAYEIEPIAKIGYTIFLYNITEEDLKFKK